jgi:hypothetical protein
VYEQAKHPKFGRRRCRGGTVDGRLLAAES